MSLPPAILQVLPALNSGGVERGTLEIAEAIQAAGFRAIVASSGGRLVTELEALGARHVTLPLATKSPLGILRNAARLAELAAAEQVQIIHARSRAPAWSALLAARRSGARLVTTYHGTYSEGWPGKRLYNSVMARGERIIAISQHIADHIRQTYGESRAIRVILRGVDLRRFDPAGVDASRVAAMRAAWSLPEGSRSVMLPARMTRWKGHGVLVRALPHLPGVIGVLAGDLAGRERYVKELGALAEAEGVADRLRFAGHVTDMPAAMLAADVIVHASTEPEAFGRTVTEAQALSRPVIASDLGGPRETVVDGVTGWLVPPGDAAALSVAIARVLAMPARELATIGEAARRNVPTLEAMQAATLAVYRELM